MIGDVSAVPLRVPCGGYCMTPVVFCVTNFLSYLLKADPGPSLSILKTSEDLRDWAIGTEIISFLFGIWDSRIFGEASLNLYILFLSAVTSSTFLSGIN